MRLFLNFLQLKGVYLPRAFGHEQLTSILPFIVLKRKDSNLKMWRRVHTAMERFFELPYLGTTT
jgi:hypothetical protein